MKESKEIIILGIETSCDDTAVAVLKAKNSNFKILSNVVASQIEVHKKYGGVYPFLAKREHQRNLLPTLETALEKAGISNFKFKISNLKTISKSKIQKPDLIAVTQGPGLEPCLWVGLNFAKEFSQKWNVPLVPVNHIESHILVNFLSKINENSKFEIRNSKQIQNSKFKILKTIFPAICLVVSGGHTQLILMKAIGKYEILGETRDDAAGECFDKCAKILGLEYPGGPAIAALAAKSEARNPKSETNFKFQILNFKLPRPMINTKDYDFSFSGLKTAVLYQNQKVKIKNKKYIQEMAREIQQAIIDVLIKKTIKAAKDFGAKSIILGGGVSANQELRKQFKEAIGKINGSHCQHEPFLLVVPPANLSTDNAVMTAVAGYFHRNKKVAPGKLLALEAKANLRL